MYLQGVTFGPAPSSTRGTRSRNTFSGSSALNRTRSETISGRDALGICASIAFDGSDFAGLSAGLSTVPYRMNL